jgi:3-oxoadipate enol-lactonase
MTTFALRVSSAARRASALACVVHGNGSPLLLIHDLGATGALFAPLMPFLADRYQLIMPDLRGHGRSSCLGAPTNVEQLAQDLRSVLDLLGVDHCAVLGYGYGGVVAAHLAATQPALVERLALLCPPNPAPRATGAARATLLPAAVRLLGTRALGSDAAPRANRSAIAAAAALLLRCDVRPWLSAIACPSLVLAVEGDHVAQQRHAIAVAAHLPHATLQMFPKCGPGLISSHAAGVAAALLDWQQR